MGAAPATRCRSAAWAGPQARPVENWVGPVDLVTSEVIDFPVHHDGPRFWRRKHPRLQMVAKSRQIG
jgi:hypothetical protein